MRNFFKTAKHAVQVWSVTAVSGAYVWYGLAHIKERQEKRNGVNQTPNNHEFPKFFDSKISVKPKVDVKTSSEDSPHPW